MQLENGQHHILYIEDHDDTRELVTLVLSEHNYRVTTGATIVQALKLSHEHHFDLYILDSWLPDGSGIELCKQLRELDPETPIMFISGAASEADKQVAIASGAQRYLVKPVDIQVVSHEVNALIRAAANNQNQAAGLALRHRTLREHVCDSATPYAPPSTNDSSDLVAP